MKAPEDTLTHMVWPRVGLTPSQLAEYAQVEALLPYQEKVFADPLNDQLKTLGEWCLKRARENHNPSTTRSMLRRKVEQILSPRPVKLGKR